MTDEEIIENQNAPATPAAKPHSWKEQSAEGARARDQSENARDVTDEQMAHHKSIGKLGSFAENAPAEPAAKPHDWKDQSANGARARDQSENARDVTDEQMKHHTSPGSLGSFAENAPAEPAAKPHDWKDQSANGA